LKGFGEVMSISERIGNTLEQWSDKWKDKLRGWFLRALSEGAEKLLDDLEPTLANEAKSQLEEIAALPELPETAKAVIGKALHPTSFAWVIILIPLAISVVMAPIMAATEALITPLRFMLNRRMKPYRFDPLAIITAWRRDPAKYAHYFDDLKDMGWDDDRVEAAKFFTQAFPTLGDVVNFYAKEAFEPDMIDKYGLENELPPYEGTYFEQLGIPRDVATKYWIAHWQHPSLGTAFELLHRGEITSEELWRWYRVVEYPPYWRDKLTAVSWDLPNRIELRMMARYGLVGKDFLITMLEKVGLAEEYRDVAADMMLAMGIRTDLSTRYSKGWINADEIRQELIDSGLSPDVQERMYQWIVKNTSDDRVSTERDLTKAEIVKGVKKGFISAVQGVELLMDMGYSKDEAEYILVINVEALSGSPETYQELKRITQLHRQATGKSAKVPSLELIQAEKDIKEAQATLDKAKQEQVSQAEITKLQAALESAKQLYHQLMASSG